ncbi:MAG: hypothetical protein NT153_05245 [Bacteroidetes bacterium]|nr:hypothetical protein [Bacteroidota bacterium]
MKVINLDSSYELTQAQISFAESVMSFDRPYRLDKEYPCISLLTEHIPVYLFSEKSMPVDSLKYADDENEYLIHNDQTTLATPATDWLGFYQNRTSIYGVDTPIIGICPERIIRCVKNDEELILLIAKVIVHEFAHAQMNFHPRDSRHSNAYYNPVDLFYKWMEEPMANVITLERFYYFTTSYSAGFTFAKCSLTPTLINPFDYVKDFINRQPNNYRLGLDFYNQRFWKWWEWRNNKALISLKVTEKADWLNYVRLNVGGTTTKSDLERLFNALK